MKYISLKCLMRAYARMAGQKHVYECLLLCSTPTADMPDQIFHISSRIVEEDGKRQMIKTVNPLIQNLFGISSRILPASLEVYPILELQWYWEEIHPVEEQFRLLEQLSYAVLFCVLARNFESEIYNRNYMGAELSERYRRKIEEEGLILEAESVKDAPKLLSHIAVPSLKKQNIRYNSWRTNLPCGGPFPSLLTAYADDMWRSHSWDDAKARAVYASLPFLAAFFGLYRKEWEDNGKRPVGDGVLDLRQIVLNLLAKIRNLEAVPGRANFPFPDTCTYAQQSTLTRADFILLTQFLITIRTGLEEMISTIGVLPYSRYRYYQANTPVKAVVRLGGIKRDWNDELENVK